LAQLTANNYKIFKWTEKDELIKGYLTKKSISHLTNKSSYQQWRFISALMSSPAGDVDVDSFVDFLHNLEVTDEQLVKSLIQYSYNLFKTFNSQKEKVETNFARYANDKLKGKSSFLGLKKTKGLGEIIDNAVNGDSRGQKASMVLEYLIEKNPDSISDFNKYLIYTHYTQRDINLASIKILLNHDPHKYENTILELISSISGFKQQFSIYLMLAELFPNKYGDKITEFGEKVFNKYCGVAPAKEARLSYEYLNRGSADVIYANFLLKKDREKAIERILRYVRESHFVSYLFIPEMEKQLGRDAVPIMLSGLHKDSNLVDKRWQDYFNRIFKLLDKYDISEHTEDLFKFGMEKTAKKYRIMTSNALTKYVDIITPSARTLLKGKVDDRIFGAMILQHSKDPVIREELHKMIDDERNDNTRDILLDAFRDVKFSESMNKAEVDNMIAKAVSRKKLNKWGEKWIDEESLPKLYWRDNGEALSLEEVRFLFYRSKRVKGMNSDIEARQVIGLLDESKSGKFAMALVKAYQDSNASSKFKYYLVMAGLIGKDSALTKLHTVFKNTVTNKRYKMAAMIVGAIAMVGSDKALRIVDTISRKYANKRRQIGVGAKEALEAAANELNITKDQLADRIIPDFGFEDHYLPFTSGEDEYRAFINKDFKLNYFNEDNKLRKSMPKDVSKETKAELKAIEKEIKEVVKTQKGRLENCLIAERSWEIDEWMNYYFSNPIMLIYVQRLLWGVYNEEHQLLNVFYCDDDLELYDVEDEEVDIEEGKYIKIVHPLHMEAGLLAKWKDKIYEMDRKFEFEQVNRTITLVPEGELERNVTKILHGKDIPKGADYVAGFLVKKGWIKSTGDGGYLEFNKINERNQNNAYANIEGPAAYYQGGTTPAKIYDVSFNNIKSRERITLNEVSDVFFSEVIADLKALIKA